MSQRSVILQIGALAFCISIVALSLTGYSISKIIIISFIVFVIVTTTTLVIVVILFPPRDDNRMNLGSKEAKKILEKIENVENGIELQGSVGTTEEQKGETVKE